MKIKKIKSYAKKKQISKKFIDVFSAGHFIKGFLSFLVIYIIVENLGFSIEHRYYCGLIVAMFSAVAWELFENFVIFTFRINGVDSLRNSLTDIVFDILGAINGLILIFFINTFT